MNTARNIRDRFGGQSALATLLGKRQRTVQHWARTGRISAQWHGQLMELAVQQGINLEPWDFVESNGTSIAPATGKLGVLLVGWGQCLPPSLPASSIYRGARGSP